MYQEISYNDSIGKDFVDNFLYNELEYNKRQKTWIELLRQIGVTAAHPDDGWVDRHNNEVILCYPRFNDGLKVGDVLALGDCDNYRLVKIIEHRIGWLGTNYWIFKDN